MISTSWINSVHKLEIRAKTLYSKAQGYAIRSGYSSMADAEIKILEVEKLHHPIILAVRMILAIPA